MVVGLYDIDFFHGSNSYPNLELMKYFNYYYNKGDIVNLMSPQEDEGRYDKIIYFKESEKLNIPKNINLAGKKKEIKGYGFFKRKIIDEKIKDVPPSYLPYDINEDKIKKKAVYNKIKKGSLVHVGSNDFTDFDENKKTIYVTDHNFLYEEKSFEFLNKYKTKYNIEFLFPLIARDEETFLKYFSSCTSCGRRLLIDFDFSKELFKKYYYERVGFLLEPPQENKKVVDFLIKVSSLILYSKIEGKSINLFCKPYNKIEIKENSFKFILESLIKWSRSKERISYCNYIESSKDAAKINKILEGNSELRLLLKQNPKTFNTQELDYFNEL